MRRSRDFAADLTTKADRTRDEALAARGSRRSPHTRPWSRDGAAESVRGLRKAARTAAVQAALAGAAAAPLETAAIAKRVAQLAERALALENPHLASDLGCAAEFAASALAAAAWNVRVNHAFMKDRATIERQEPNSPVTNAKRARRSNGCALRSRGRSLADARADRAPRPERHERQHVDVERIDTFEPYAAARS